MGHVNTFLRKIDVVPVFRNGKVLLLSECEADHILGLLWITCGKKTKCSFHFMNLAFDRESLARGEAHTKFSNVFRALGYQVVQELPLLSAMACHFGCQVSQDLPLLSTMACHSFNGEKMIAKEQQAKVEQAFRDLLRPLVQREVTQSDFVKSRGNCHMWMRSFFMSFAAAWIWSAARTNALCVMVPVRVSDRRVNESCQVNVIDTTQHDRRFQSDYNE